MENSVYRLQVWRYQLKNSRTASIITFSPLIFGEVNFIRDKSKRKEDHATSTISTRKEPDGGEKVEFWEDMRASTSNFSSVNLQPPPGLHRPSTSGSGGGKAVVTKSSPSQSDLQEALHRSQKRKISSTFLLFFLGKWAEDDKSSP